MTPAKLKLHLPANHYKLTAEDTRRFAEEAALGMVAPHDPVLALTAQSIAPNKIKSAKVQHVVARLLEVASNQQQERQVNKKRRTLVGLAAPQIGESVRLVVIDTKIRPDRKNPGYLECFINPEIMWRTRETVEGREGCFSAGPVWGLVRRPVAIKIRAYTPEGKRIERIFEDFTARVACHEIDHLDGIRFADRIVSDRKRHWVNSEELAEYLKHIQRWPRICTRERWEALKQGTQTPG